MDTIPTIKASHILPFAETLKQVGAPLDQLLRQANLPSQIIYEPDAFLVEPALWALVDHASHREGINNFGVLCMQSRSAMEMIQEIRSWLGNCVTLYEALETFCQLIPQQNSHANYWMEARETETWFWRIGLKNLGLTSWQVEQYVLTLITQLIRVSAGKDWRPNSVCLQVESAKLLKDIPMLTGVKTCIAQPYTGIAIENELLSQAFDRNIPLNSTISTATYKEGLEVGTSKDFIGSLRQVLQAYLSDGRPDIDMIAEATRNSTRTLQRRLSNLGVSYSTVLQQARFEKSAKLLQEKNIKLTDIAFEVGYSSPAHFARAFRSIAGVSPRQYRKHVLEMAA